MRVLVTGHKGFIGVGHGADAARGGRRGRRASTPTSTGTARSRGQLADVPEIRRDIRDAEPGRRRRLRRRRPPRRAVERPARRLRPRAHLRHQPPGHDPPGPAGPPGRRAAVPVLVVVQQLRRRRRRPARRDRPVQPGDALRRVEGARRAGPARAGHRRLQPGAAAQRHGLRRLAAAALRHRAQQPDGVGGGHRQGASSRATARRGGRSSTSRTSAAPSSPRCRRRARPCTPRPSTWPGPTTTTGSASWPRSCTRRCPAARSSSPGTPAPTPATTASTRSKIATRPARRSSRSGRPRRAPSSSTRRSPSTASPSTTSRAGASAASARSRSCSTPRELGPDLRWKVRVGRTGPDEPPGNRIHGATCALRLLVVATADAAAATALTAAVGYLGAPDRRGLAGRPRTPPDATDGGARAAATGSSCSIPAHDEERLIGSTLDSLGRPRLPGRAGRRPRRGRQLHRRHGGHRAGLTASRSTSGSRPTTAARAPPSSGCCDRLHDRGDAFDAVVIVDADTTVERRTSCG